MNGPKVRNADYPGEACTRLGHVLDLSFLKEVTVTAVQAGSAVCLRCAQPIFYVFTMQATHRVYEHTRNLMQLLSIAEQVPAAAGGSGPENPPGEVVSG